MLDLQNSIEKLELHQQQVQLSVQEQVDKIHDHIGFLNEKVKSTGQTILQQVKSLETIVEHNREKSEAAEQESVKRYRSVATTVNQLIDMMSAKVPRNLST